MRWQATGGKHQLIIMVLIIIMKLLYRRHLIKRMHLFMKEIKHIGGRLNRKINMGGEH